jgi:integrase/recombinase XerD
VTSGELAELSERFLAACRYAKSLSDNTVAAYAQDLRDFRHFHAPWIAGRPTAGTDVQDYVRFLREERRQSPATAKRRIACLKAFFRWAKQEGAVAASPFDEVAITVRVPKRLPRALSRGEVRKITTALARPAGAPRRGRAPHLDPRSQRATTYLALCLMLATGMRVGELTHIRLPDIDPEFSAIRLRGKGARDRLVFITNEALRARLSAYAEAHAAQRFADDLLLRNTLGAPLTAQALRLRLRKLGDGLSLGSRVTPHRFRHTAATVLLEEGVDIRYVQRLLGHSSISTTEIYTAVSDGSLKAALTKADVMGRVVAMG